MEYLHRSDLIKLMSVLHQETIIARPAHLAFTCNLEVTVKEDNDIFGVITSLFEFLDNEYEAETYKMLVLDILDQWTEAKLIQATPSFVEFEHLIFLHAECPLAMQ